MTGLATAVDIRCGGSLGTRSVRKQIQALLHFAIGNQKLRINANTLVPSTSALVITGTVGAGKSIYHKLFEQVVGLMTEATNELDKQIHDARLEHKDNVEEINESTNLSQLISGVMDGKGKTSQRFKSRKLLRNPGTKEGWEKALEVETRIIQLVAEGNDWWLRMSRGATLDQRSATLLYLNEMIDGETLVVDLKTKGLSTRARNCNNTMVIYGHPMPCLRAQDSLKGAGI